MTAVGQPPLVGDLLGHDGKTPLDLARETFGDGHAITDLIRDRAATS